MTALQEQAARAISSYDQLSAGIMEGDQEYISEARELLQYWSDCASDCQIDTLREAMRARLATLATGGRGDLLEALKAVRGLAESVMSLEER